MAQRHRAVTQTTRTARVRCSRRTNAPPSTGGGWALRRLTTSPNPLPTLRCRDSHPARATNNPVQQTPQQRSPRTVPPYISSSTHQNPKGRAFGAAEHLFPSPHTPRGDNGSKSGGQQGDNTPHISIGGRKWELFSSHLPPPLSTRANCCCFTARGSSTQHARAERWQHAEAAAVLPSAPHTVGRVALSRCGTAEIARGPRGCADAGKAAGRFGAPGRC
jgi:hypothetical protein